MSIKWKMTLWYMLVMLLMAAVMLAFMLNISDTVAESRAQEILTRTVDLGAQDVWFEHGQLESFGFMTFLNGVALQIYDADGNLLKGVSPVEVDVDTFGSTKTQKLTENGSTLYLYSIWVADKSSALYSGASGEMSASGEMGASGEMSEATGVWVCGVLAAASLENVLSSIVRLAFITLPILLLLAFFGGWLIASRSLAPVRMIAQSAQEISDGTELSRRIEIGEGKDEIHALARTFNDMFARLERSFQAERRFTSDASHELRTPAAVILAECDMAKKVGDDPAELRESLTVVERQARRMSAIISRLLMFNRLDQGRQKVQFAEVDLSQLVTDVCEEQRKIEERGIRLESDIQPDVHAVGEEQLLISLLQNLIVNARKYGKENGHIHVQLRADAEQVSIRVRDDGEGIAPEELPRIWKRFYQTDKARSNKDGSMGLGLPMAQEIAHIHHGEVTAESVPGEGSTFVFTMPMQKTV